MRSVSSGQHGKSKWQEIFMKENEALLSRNQYIKGKNNFLRPPMVTTYECKNVLIEGVSFSNPPFWTIMPAFRDNITITGITIENPGRFTKYRRNRSFFMQECTYFKLSYYCGR